MDQQLTLRKRARQDSTESTDSPDLLSAKRIRDNLLVLLDDEETAPSGDEVVVTGDGPVGAHDLDSVIKSFEEELSGSAALCNSIPISGSDSGGESHPELGFLLGASDDELGLPSTAHQSSTLIEDHQELVTASSFHEPELIRVSSDSSGVCDDIWQFNDGLVSYDDPFGFGITDAGNTIGNDYVSLDGIFDYSDVNFGPSDYTTTDENNNNSSTWRQETLPAL